MLQILRRIRGHQAFIADIPQHVEKNSLQESFPFTKISHRFALCLAVSAIALPAAAQTDSSSARTTEIPPFLTESLRDGLDTTVSPCTDFDRFVNGGWRARTKIPEDMTQLNVFVSMTEETRLIINRLIDSSRHVGARTPDANWRVVGTYYESCLVADTLDKLTMVSTMAGARKQDTSRVSRCRRLVMRDLQDALSQIFVQAVLTPEIEARAWTLTKTILESAQTRVDGLSWASAEAKTHAREQLGKLKLRVVKPEKGVDHSELVLTSNDVVENQKRIKSFLWKYNLLSVGGSRPIWSQSQYFPNASFNARDNSIEVPTFMFRAPYFDTKREPAMGYAGVGTMLGHEVFHGITAYVSATSNDQYNQLTKRLIQHYSDLPPVDSVFIDGELTLNENLGDLGGVLAAYDAWQRSSRKKATQKIEGFTPEQRFFLYFAQLWRTKTTPKYAKTLSHMDVHSLPYARVNGVVMNIPAFATAFGCREGDPMAKRKAERVEIW